MRVAAVALVALIVAAPALAQTQVPAAAPADRPAPPPPAPYGSPVTTAQAQRAIAAAEAFGRANGWNLAIAVVEPTGELVAFLRMDGTGYAANDVARAKARTAARGGRETRAYQLTPERLWPLAIEGLIPVEGGVPIVVDGKTVGAIGVSGASAYQDGEAARAGARAAAEG